MSPRLLLTLALLLTLYAYRGVWSAGYVYEDENAVYANPVVTGAESQNLTRARWLSALSHRVVYKAFGKEPRAPHLVNVGLHAVNGVLVYAVLSLWIPALGAAVAASLFLLHPLQVEAVAYIASRSELLACLFVLLAVLAWHRRDRWQLPLVVLCVALAVCAKESAAVIVPILLVLELTRRQRPAWVTLAVCVVPVALMAYSVWRFEYVFRPDPNRLEYAGLQALAVWRYLAMVVVPIGQSIDHDFDLVPHLWRWVALYSLLAVACGAALLACTVGDETKQASRLWDLSPALKASACGVLWLVIALVPRFLIPLNEALNEHQTYGPFIGLWLLIGAWVAKGAAWPNPSS